MKVIFSRKGFDSASGGAPSPIIEDVPTSLPIPTNQRSCTTYEDIGYGELVELVTKGRIKRTYLCHFDPMFENGRCAFGQTGAAQSHLANNGVGVGDIFLFFGLFSDVDGRHRHHRIFGYLKVDEMSDLGNRPGIGKSPTGFSIKHPHTIGKWNENNCLYIGKGNTTQNANDEFRLTEQGGRLVSHWTIPAWLSCTGLTYHSRRSRWTENTLHVVSRGQEFVADISNSQKGQRWVRDIIDAIDRSHRS